MLCATPKAFVLLALDVAAQQPQQPVGSGDDGQHEEQIGAVPQIDGHPLGDGNRLGGIDWPCL